MSEQDIERVPDFQKWLGKKVLSIKPLDIDVSPNIGDLVMVFEAFNEMRVGEAVLRQSEYRFARPMPYFMEYLYTEGIYRLAGIGVVTGRLQSPYGSWQIMLNDTVRDVFTDTIPF